MKISNQSFSKLVTCATLMLALSSCSGGGSGGGGTTAPPTPAAASVTVTNPVQGAANLPTGPVLVTFDIQNSPVPLSATQPRMHFYVDDDPVPYMFYDGPGITETGTTSGVRYQGVHTHFVHWKSGSSIQFNALASGSHRVQFVLVDQAEAPIPITPQAVTNLVTAYGMNEGSGTTLADASGSGHTGTLINGPAWVDGQTTYGKALSFDGLNNEAVSVANPGTYNFGTADFTLETWVKRNVLGGGQRHLFSTCTVATWMPGCKEFYFNASNQLTFGSNGDTFSSTIADTNWHHIAVTFTNSTKVMQFYVDGALATTAPKPLMEADNPGHVMTIGNLFGNNSFSGLLDEFRIYNRVLTPAEIQAELRSTTAKTLAFTILPGTGGEFSLQEVASGLSVPVQMATAPDGRIFVTELNTGNIQVVTPTATLPWQVQAIPFATLPVVTGGERGLLGIAIHPNFIQNGFVYVFYTASATVNRVVRFTAMMSGVNTVATAATPDIIFDNIPAAPSHNGGVIHFGPDGMLYIFVGENDMPAQAQSLGTLGGKFLRIKPDGTIPPDNPFVSTPLSAPFSAIYSLGHRNSFGFTFHPLTNDLWQTENGPNDSDEINRIIEGGNYGWDLAQDRGVLNNPPNFTDLTKTIDPIAVYFPAPPCDPSSVSCTIAPTGIVAFREDSVYPAQYHNNLLFADFNGGKLHRIVLGGAMLTNFVSDSIACDCGLGPLFAVMHGLNVPGQDGYIYVSSGSSILRVVLN